MRERITPKQAYVLSQLDRVTPWHYVAPRPSSSPRYKLDGWDCSEQIRGLTVKAYIVRKPDGSLARASDDVAL